MIKKLISLFSILIFLTACGKAGKVEKAASFGGNIGANALITVSTTTPSVEEEGIAVTCKVQKKSFRFKYQARNDTFQLRSVAIGGGASTVVNVALPILVS